MSTALFGGGAPSLVPARRAGRRRGLSQPLDPTAVAAGLGVLLTIRLDTHRCLTSASRLCCLRGCPVCGSDRARAHRRLARSEWARRRAPRRRRRLRRPRAARRPRDGADPEGQAPPRRGDRVRAAPGGARSHRGAVPALRRLRRLPLAGSALRASALEHKQQQVLSMRCSASLGCPSRRSRRSCRPCASTPTATSSVRLDDHRRRALGSTAPAAGRTSCRSQVCLLTARARQRVARARYVAWASQGPRAFDQRANTGRYLRHLVVREGVRTGETACKSSVTVMSVPGA